MYKRILVATDGGALSQTAVSSAVELAAAIGAELVALYVVPRYPISYFEGGITMSMDTIANTEKQWLDKGQAIVDAVKDRAKTVGVTTSAVVSQSDLVAEAIMSTAAQHQCDLVVMASHGRKGIQRVLLGSETQHVLTHSTIPVLVLR